MTLSIQALQHAINNWDSTNTRTIFQDPEIGPIEYRALFKAAAQHPKSETTNIFLYKSQFQARALLSIRDPEFDLGKNEIDLVTIHGNYPYGVILFRHPRLKAVAGDKLFYELCRNAMKSPNESISEAIARNCCFPIAELKEYTQNIKCAEVPYPDPIDLAFLEPNSKFAKGIAGNPNFPFVRDVIEVAIDLRKKNGGKPTQFEIGLTEHPEFQKFVSKT